MRHFSTGLMLTIGATLSWMQPARAQAADELLEFIWETTEPIYSQTVTFERALVFADYADGIRTLDDIRTHTAVVGVYELSGLKSNGQWSAMTTTIMTPDESFVPEGVIMIAGAYRAEPRSILEGYMSNATVSKADGMVTYTVEGNGSVPTYKLLVDDAVGRIVGAHIGYGESKSLQVKYDYDAIGEISRVVAEFSTSENPEMRWALVDIPLDPGTRSQSSSAPTLAGANSFVPQRPNPTSSGQQLAAKDGVVSAPIDFVSSEDLFDPINLGTTSCTASNGACFDFLGLDICFNIGLGVSLATNSSIAMDGHANVRYPVEGREGEAGVTLTGTTGSSSIDYSFAYDAEICASVTVPVLGTCTSSIQLAQGSVTAASGEEFFSPFLLPGDSERPVCTGDAIDPLLVGVSPSITLCDLTLGFTGGLNIDPSLDYCISGDYMRVSRQIIDINGANFFNEGIEAFVPAVDGMNDFLVNWRGEASLTGTLTLTPALSVTIPGFGEVSLPLGSFPFDLGGLDVSSVSMSNHFEVDLCSEPPRSPFRLFASRGAATDRVNLDWQGVPIATGYRVFRAQQKNLSDAQDISGVTTELWYTDTTATTGMGGCISGTDPIHYYYYIVAVNDCGESAPGVVAIGYVAESTSLAMLSPSSLGDFSVFVITLATLFLLRRRRHEPMPNL